MRITRAIAAPHPLAGIVFAIAVVGVMWALFVPPWQSPDEADHFAYAQSLATRFALPGSADRPSYSSAQLTAAAADNASVLRFNPLQVRPDWSARDFDAYLARVAAAPSSSNGGGPNTESPNPPLLYLYDDLAYWVSGGNTFDQLYAMRLWNVTLLLGTVIGAWLLAGEVFDRRRLPQTVCAGVVGLIPQQTYILTSVNPDAMTVPLWTLSLWLGTRVILRRAPGRDVLALFALTAAAILTKASSYALVPPVLVAVAIGCLRRPAADRARAARGALAAAPALIVPVLAWLGVTRSLGRPAVNQISAPAGVQPQPFSVRQFISYVWQFYLPRAPFMRVFNRAGGALGVNEIWIKGGWGMFGYLDVPLPLRVYDLLGACTVAVGAWSAWLLTRLRDRARLLVLGFYAVALLSLLALLHISEYRSLIADEGPLLQGRYLLPLSGLFGLAVALITVRLPARWRAGVAGAVLAGLLVLQVVALATVAKAYYT